jgi:hypothetical protein
VIVTEKNIIEGEVVKDNQMMALPEEQQFRKDLAAINQFQTIVQQQMIPGHDFGTIPGTHKPTLLKPGAEKIAKLLGLADEYDILDRQERWDSANPFFRYLVKCRLVNFHTRQTVSEGLGECNSMESKYRWRWVWPDEVPENVVKAKLLKKEFKGRRGQKLTQYRMENEDIFSQVNTLLKMAKKRALVDAALSAGRLSDLFTQDIEDMREGSIRVDVAAEEPAVGAASEPGEPEEINFDETKKQSQQAKAQRDPQTIKTIGDLFQACHDDYGMMARDVIKELGYSSKADIAETPAECFIKIRDIKESKK